MSEESDDVLPLASAVARELHVSLKDLFSNKKSKSIVLARQLLAHLLRNQGLSYPEIAKKMGYKYHTSPMTSVAVFNKKLENDVQVKAHLYSVLRDVSEGAAYLPNSVRVSLPQPVVDRLHLLLQSGCYGSTMSEVTTRILGHAVYQLVKDVDTVEEKS